jgi:hypothetical protein
MVRVYPTNEHGEQIGPVSIFSDDQWAKLKTIKPFRWAEVKTVKKTTVELMPTDEDTKSLEGNQATAPEGRKRKNQQNKK